MLELLQCIKVIPEIEKFFIIFINLTLISIAISTISLTIATSTMFSWFRNLFEMKETDTYLYDKEIGQKALTVFGKIKSFFEELFNCHYCVSHWVSLFFVHFYRPQIFENKWINFIVLMFMLVGTSAWISKKTYESVRAVQWPKDLQ